MEVKIMSSKVFISWSGELSKKLAEELRIWLPAVLQFVKPYFTPNDIEKGTSWSTSITAELSTSNIGILCLTKDNISEPWILFEAGALSKNFDKANVCTILFNLDTSDLSGPLTNFQATRFEKEDFRKLITTINNTGDKESQLVVETLNEVFEMWWPRLEEKIKNILQDETKSTHNKRTDRELLEEILEISRLNITRLTMRRDNNAHTHKIRNILQDLIERLVEARKMTMSNNIDNSVFEDIIEIINAPLRALCNEMDMETLYDDYQMRIRRYRSRIMKNRE
jgi:hypothetical protein